MINVFTEVLTDPNDFFDERLSDMSVRFSLLALFLYILSRAAAFFPALFVIEAGIGTILLYGSVGLVVGNTIRALAAWILYAVIFYALSILFGGEGSFRDTLKITAGDLSPSFSDRSLRSLPRSSLRSVVLRYR